MAIKCVWEHNGADSLLYAADLPGAYARGANREETLQKMRQELPQFLQWAGGELPPEELAPVIVQEKKAPCGSLMPTAMCCLKASGCR